MGKPLSEETKAKIAAKKRGVATGPRTDETKQKMSKVQIERRERERAERNSPDWEIKVGTVNW